jgi:hypothetical protein
VRIDRDSERLGDAGDEALLDLRAIEARACDRGLCAAGGVVGPLEVMAVQGQAGRVLRAADQIPIDVRAVEIRPPDATLVPVGQ